MLGEDGVERDYENDDVPMDYASAPKAAPDPMASASTASAESSRSNEEDEEALNYFAKLASQ